MEEDKDSGKAEITSEILRKHAGDKGALLQILREVQAAFGYVPKSSMLAISGQLGIPLSQVYSAVTFYNEFRTEKMGKHLIRVCLGTACCVRRSKEIMDELESVIKIREGETDPAGIFTLERVNCVGACSLGPVVEVDGRLYPRMNPKKARSLILEILKREGR
jgi:NADH:ubiquinone oxidoreductase subunit E